MPTRADGAVSHAAGPTTLRLTYLDSRLKDACERIPAREQAGSPDVNLQHPRTAVSGKPLEFEIAAPQIGRRGDGAGAKGMRPVGIGIDPRVCDRALNGLVHGLA